MSDIGSNGIAMIFRAWYIDRVGDLVRTDINHGFVQRRVIGFMIPGAIGLLECVMPCTRQAVAADSAVVLRFVAGLSIAGKAYDHISGLYPVIGHQLVLGPARGHRPIYGDRPDYIPHVRSF